MFTDMRSSTLRSATPTRSRLLSGLTAALLMVSSVTVAAVTTEQAAYAATARLSVTPGNFVGGQRLHWSGNVGHTGVRPLVLQFHMGRAGDMWTTVAGFRSRTRADGGFSFGYRAPGMMNIRYRVKAGRYVTPSKLLVAKTQELTIRVAGQRENNTNEPGRVAAGRNFAITVDTTPDNVYRSPTSKGLPVFRGRTLTLQERIDGDTWATVGTTTVGTGGMAQFTGLNEKAGVVVYRVREEDYTPNGNRIGWTQSFPLYVYVGPDAWARHLRKQAAARMVRSTTPRRAASRGSAPTGTASARNHWYPSLWDFAWEYGESLTSPPARGSRVQGSWLDYTTGAGRVSKQNGGLGLDSKRYHGAGTGDFGTTRVTMRGNDSAQGRWEARMRIRAAFERGGPDYGILAELVPANEADYDCGQHNITIASISPYSQRVDFGVRSPGRRWSGTTFASSTPNSTAYAVAVEVSNNHITWFLNGSPIGSVTDGAALSGLPMTLRFSLVGDGQKEMNQVSLVSDWQRGFPITTGHQTVSDKRLGSSAASGC